MTWLERQAINFWSAALSFAAWVLLFFCLPKISLIDAWESPVNHFSHSAVTALCAGLLLRVFILLIQKFPPKNLQQRQSDDEELKQQRINEAKMRETAAAQERIDRIAEAARADAFGICIALNGIGHVICLAMRSNVSQRILVRSGLAEHLIQALLI